MPAHYTYQFADQVTHLLSQWLGAFLGTRRSRIVFKFVLRGIRFSVVE